jgi:hypothetical protein
MRHAPTGPRWLTSVLAATCAATFAACPPQIASAAVLLRGEVTIASGADAPTPSAALYLTARPNVADDVPKAILSGTRGKSPPIASARIPPPLTFPLAFQLDDEADLTPEGMAEPRRWWARKELILSARLDSDGMAATRDASDLVGRTVCAPLEGEGADGARPLPGCSLSLVGRGFGGKLITTRK